MQRRVHVTERLYLQRHFPYFTDVTLNYLPNSVYIYLRVCVCMSLTVYLHTYIYDHVRANVRAYTFMLQYIA